MSELISDSAQDWLRPPNKIEELGVPASLVEDLFTRRLLIERMATVSSVSVDIGIRMSIGREIADELRNRQVLEYHGLEGRDYRIGLTQAGHKLATDRLQNSSYAGITPVSLAAYTRTIWAQKADLVVNRESIRAAFGDLVVEDALLDQLGPAFLSDGAIFLYGPPGTGKTSLAERMIRIHKDKVLVPHAVEVDGQVITVFDPAIHKPGQEQPDNLDPRWVLCERPIVVVGGELTMSMLELDHDASSGTYTAPIQMQANNGILVVDDFGRQLMSPDELLNRWIVPLSRNIDFLKLQSGTKFTVPFELKLVASTNLDPAQLGDDAFLRRLRNKVFVGPITDNAFNWILVRVAQAHDVEVSAEAAQYLRAVAIKHIGELRPYVAVDFCELMVGIASYEGRPRTLDRYMIDRVAQVYFFSDEGVAPEPPPTAPTAAPLPASAPQPQAAPPQPQAAPPPQPQAASAPPLPARSPQT